MKPNRNQQISQAELDQLETIEYNEYVEGHKSDDLQGYLDFTCHRATSLAMLICITMVGLLLFTGNVQAKEYTNDQIVNAIRKAEGSWTYGIKSVKCETSTECRQICFNTVKRNRQRFAKLGQQNKIDFIAFLANRYCPIGASNDPSNLNKNWQINVRYFLAKEAHNGNRI